MKPNLLVFKYWIILLSEVGMKIFTTLFCMFCLSGSALAGGTPVAAAGPEMSAGIVGMTLAAGVLYLIKRRQRS